PAPRRRPRRPHPRSRRVRGRRQQARCPDRPPQPGELMSHTTLDTVQDAAAVALTTALPLPAAVRAARSVGAPVGTQVTNAVTATLVGASGADLAVALIDESQVAVDPASQGATDAVAAAL